MAGRFRVIAVFAATALAMASGARGAFPDFDTAGNAVQIQPEDAPATASEKDATPFAAVTDGDIADAAVAVDNANKIKGGKEGLANKAEEPLGGSAAERQAKLEAIRKASRFPGHGRPCENDCSGKGLCYDGVCDCHENWFGDDCAKKYMDGETRERRSAERVRPHADDGSPTVGAAAQEDGALTPDNAEKATPSERKRLDEATEPAKPEKDEGPTEGLEKALEDEAETLKSNKK